jgi:hypothetical protein
MACSTYEDCPGSALVCSCSASDSCCSAARQSAQLERAAGSSTSSRRLGTARSCTRGTAKAPLLHWRRCRRTRRRENTSQAPCCSRPSRLCSTHAQRCCRRWPRSTRSGAPRASAPTGSCACADLPSDSAPRDTGTLCACTAPSSCLFSRALRAHRAHESSGAACRLVEEFGVSSFLPGQADGTLIFSQARAAGSHCGRSRCGTAIGPRSLAHVTCVPPACARRTRSCGAAVGALIP